jgi:hypothetical protein
MLDVLRKVKVQRDSTGLYVVYMPSGFYYKGKKLVIRQLNAHEPANPFVEGERVHLRVSSHKKGLFYVWRPHEKVYVEWLGPHWVQPIGVEGRWEE